MKSKQTLILTRSQVESLITFKDALAAMETVFRSHGEGKSFNLTKNFQISTGPISIKAGAVESIGLAGLKSLGLVVVCSLDRLREPVAILEQSYITFLRTGAAGALATRYLARPESKTVGILGSGRQARAQLEGLYSVFPGLKEAFVWSPTSEHRHRFVAEMRERIRGLHIEAVDEPRKAVQDRDIVITATRAKKPLVEKDWITLGTHITAVGVDYPGSAELSVPLLQASRIFTDDLEQASWMGTINTGISQGTLDLKKDVAGSLGQVVASLNPGRRTAQEITVFDCSGLGMMDVALADLVVKRAEKQPSLPRVDWLG